MKQLFLIVSILVFEFLVCSCSYALNEGPNTERHYVVNQAKDGKTYYHLSYQLKGSNLVKIDQLSEQKFKDNGGQFEVRIKKDLFPIKAPACKSDIILRMPWAPPNYDPGAKYTLYKNIVKVFQGEKESIRVAIELNPYVEMKNSELSLTQCNVFFRHADHEYVPHTKSLDAR